jgi:branched-chain amino acid transport system permease protein
LIAPVVTTLGLLGILQSTIILFWGLENRSINSPFSTKGFMVGETILPFSPSDLAIFIVVLIAILILVLIFQKTSIGLQLRASAFAPEISRLSGIKVDFVRTVGWSLAGAIGGLAGVLATSITVVNPYSLDILLVFGFVAAVIGGLDSLFGAVAGSLVLGIAINFSVAFINSQMIFPITFFVLILCLLIRPEGLFSSTKVRKDS